MTLRLRDYQQRSIDVTLEQFARGTTSGVLHLFTGAGKSFITTKLVEEGFPAERCRSVVVGGINRQLVLQMRDNFSEHYPKLNGSIYTDAGQHLPGLGIVMGTMDNVDARVICASVQTLVDSSDSLKKGEVEREAITKEDCVLHGDGSIQLSVSSERRFLVSPRFDAILAHGRVDLWVHDEAHHIVADGSFILLERVKQLYKALSLPPLLVVGNTATPVRVDGRALSNVFEKIFISRNFRWGQEHNYLAPFATPLRVAIEGVDQQTNIGVGEVVVNEVNNWASMMVRAWKENCLFEDGSHRPTFAFVGKIDSLGGVEASKILAEEFNESGISAAHIDGTGCIGPDGERISNSDRGELFERYTRGEIKVLCNFGVLIEGIDLPLTSCIFLGRKVNDVMLTQIIGRMLRLYPGDERHGLPAKKDALLLDCTGQALVTSSVGTLMGFKIDPFSKDYVDDLGIEELAVRFAPLYEEAKAAIHEWIHFQQRWEPAEVFAAIGGILSENLDTVTKTHCTIIRAICDYFGEDALAEGMDMRDVNPVGQIQGAGASYKVAKIISSSNGDWYADNDNVMTLAVGAGHSLLIHPAKFSLADKAKLVTDIAAKVLSGDEIGIHPYMLKLRDAGKIEKVYKMFKFAQTLFGNYTLWHINTYDLRHPVIFGSGSWVAADPAPDMVELAAIDYAVSEIPETTFMGKGQSWKARTRYGQPVMPSDKQIYVIKRLLKGKEVPELTKGEAAKLITHLTAIQPVNLIVDKITKAMETFPL